MESYFKHIIVIDTSPIFGGAQRSLLTTLQGLKHKGVDLLVVSGSSRLADEVKALGIPGITLPFKTWTRSINGVLNAGTDILQFKGFLDGFGVKKKDAVFYANGIQAGLLLTLTLPKTARLVVHHRDIQCPKMALKKVVRRADTNIVLTQFMASKLAERLAGKRPDTMRVVYNGFDFHSLGTLADEKMDMGLPNDRSVVTFVADLVPWKRHDLFIDAMALALETEPKLFGLIIGGVRERAGESYRESLMNRVAEHRCDASIKFAGSIGNPMPAIRNSAVLCALSDDEPFGRTVIEAAGVGTPMVVRDPGGPAELVQGLPSATVVGADPETIAKAIVAMANAPRFELDETWKQRFSVEAHIETVFEILNA